MRITILKCGKSSHSSRHIGLPSARQVFMLIERLAIPLNLYPMPRLLRMSACLTILFLAGFLAACVGGVQPQSENELAPFQTKSPTSLVTPLVAHAPSPSSQAHVLGPEPTKFVTLTPGARSTQIPTASMSQEISVTSQIYSLALGEQYPAKFALDETFIYWTGGSNASLFRFPIKGGENELLARSQFQQYHDGYLFSERMIRTGDWLIFMDTRLNDTGRWALHAMNLKTMQDKIVMQENASRAPVWSPLPDYSAEGDWLAWARLDLGNPNSCDQSILGVTNLATGEERELDRVCTADHYMWVAPLLSDNHLIVEQDLPDKQGRKNNIYLWDWMTGTREALTTNGYSSMPAVFGKWVVWKNAPRFTESRDDLIYDLATNQQISFRVPNGCSSDPRVSAHWLYTQPCGGTLSAYDLEKRRMVKIISLPKGEEIEGLALSEQWAVWGVARDTAAGREYEIQWRRLP